MQTQHRLEPNFWAKILLVRYKNHPAGHAYCVWETEGTIYGYDRNAGSFPIPVYTREPKVIAGVLADGLSKVLNERLTRVAGRIRRAAHDRPLQILGRLITSVMWTLPAAKRGSGVHLGQDRIALVPRFAARNIHRKSQKKMRDHCWSRREA